MTPHDLTPSDPTGYSPIFLEHVRRLAARWPTVPEAKIRARCSNHGVEWSEGRRYIYSDRWWPFFRIGESVYEAGSRLRHEALLTPFLPALFPSMREWTTNLQAEAVLLIRAGRDDVGFHSFTDEYVVRIGDELAPLQLLDAYEPDLARIGGAAVAYWRNHSDLRPDDMGSMFLELLQHFKEEMGPVEVWVRGFLRKRLDNFAKSQRDPLARQRRLAGGDKAVAVADEALAKAWTLDTEEEIDPEERIRLIRTTACKDDLDRRIFDHNQQACRDGAKWSIEEIARRLKVRPHVVRYRWDKIRKAAKTL